MLSWAGLSRHIRIPCVAAQVGPPTFVLFTTGELEPGYVRFLQRRLREEFGFVGTPVHVELRVREKGRRK